MSKYTTGELAKLCGVTVRTVQYYDARNILVPSELSEGGRRLYNDEDLRKMRIICFLRDLGISINAIGDLFSGDDPEKVIEVILAEQKRGLQDEIAQRQDQLSKLTALEKELRSVEHFSVESIGDIAYVVENKKKLRRLYATLLAGGIVMDVLQVAALILGIFFGIWWPFAACMPVVILLGIWISSYYFRRVEYICPQCHTVFKPTFKESFFAAHTPTTRKLTCPHCGRKGYCVEIYKREGN